MTASAPRYVERMLADYGRDRDDRFLHLGHFDEPGADDVDGRRRLADVLLSAAEVPHGATLLDVGCGMGGLLGHLAGARPDVLAIGVDVSAEMLARARSFGDATLLRADAGHLPVGTSTVDRVVSIEAMLHFPSRPAFLAEARRVLRPGGRLVASDLLVSVDAPALLGSDAASLAAELDAGFGPWPAPWIEPEELVAQALAAGFGAARVVDATEASLPTYVAPQRVDRPVAAQFSDEAWARRFVRLHETGAMRLVHLVADVEPADAPSTVRWGTAAAVRAGLTDPLLVADDAAVDCGQRRPLPPLQSTGDAHRTHRALLDDALAAGPEQEAIVRRRVVGLLGTPEALCRTLPGLVLLDLLRLPESDLEQWWAWHDGINGSRATGGSRADRRRLGDEVHAYFAAHARERTGGDGTDLLTRAAATAGIDDTARLGHLLLLAGLGTVTEALTAVVRCVQDDPTTWAALAGDPSAVRVACAEVLRWATPVPGIARTALPGAGGPDGPVPAGTLVDLSIALANRDPAEFTDPDRLDLSRSPNRHLAFGFGAHRCVGAALAQLQMRVVVEELTR